MRKQDLECRGVKFTEELRERVVREIKARFDGRKDDVLQEPLHEIIINEYSAIQLEQELAHLPD